MSSIALALSKHNAATRNNTFFDGCAGCVERVIDAVLALFHFDFSSAADLENSNTASEFRKTFLQLLTVVVGSGFFDLRADLVDAAFDVLLLADAVDDRRVVFGDRDALGSAEHVECDRLRA